MRTAISMIAVSLWLMALALELEYHPFGTVIFGFPVGMCMVMDVYEFIEKHKKESSVRQNKKDGDE